jgi:hypothetical protein
MLPAATARHGDRAAAAWQGVRPSRRTGPRVSESGGWEQVERAEARLDERARARERQRRRRAIRATVARWTATVALPLIGSATFAWMLEAAGGDLRGWSDAQAVSAVAGAWLWPAALAGWLWRRHGAPACLAATFGVFCAQTGVTFGIAFTVLGYGP